MIKTVTKTQHVTTPVSISYPIWQVGNTAIRYNLDRGRFEFTDDVTQDEPDWERFDHWGDWMPYDMDHNEKADFLTNLAKLVRKTVLDARLNKVL